MTAVQYRNKTTPRILDRKAIVYLGQSSERRVQRKTRSRRPQHALADRAGDVGWKRAEIIDSDLGHNAAMDAAERAGFDRLFASATRGEVGIVFSSTCRRDTP